MLGPPMKRHFNQQNAKHTLTKLPGSSHVTRNFPIQIKFDIARIFTRILTNVQATLIYLKDERLKAPQNDNRNNCLTSVMLTR